LPVLNDYCLTLGWIARRTGPFVLRNKRPCVRSVRRDPTDHLGYLTDPRVTGGLASCASKTNDYGGSGWIISGRLDRRRPNGRFRRTGAVVTIRRASGLRRCGSVWPRCRRHADVGRMHQAGGLVKNIFDELESELLKDLLRSTIVWVDQRSPSRRTRAERGRHAHQPIRERRSAAETARPKYGVDTCLNNGDGGSIFPVRTITPAVATGIHPGYWFAQLPSWLVRTLV
jgi:hypothetical protein